MEKLALLGGPQAVPAERIKKWPYITEQDKKAVMDAMDFGIFSHDTPQINGLQKDWAAYNGSNYCLATNSGTSALHMSVAALGIGPGDEVIIPAYTFVATATAVLHHNAIPVFIDVEPGSWNIDVTQIEAAITPYTKAIIPVHLNGCPADMDEVLAIARRHGLAVIEDACQAHGAVYKGRKTGTLGDAAGFSLNAFKNLGAGDGGLFVTQDEETMERALMVREFGERTYKGKRREYNSYAMGWMYRTTEFVGAFARSQLTRLDEMNACRVDNAMYLREALAGYDFVSLPDYKDDRTCVYWAFPLMVSAEKAGVGVDEEVFRDMLADALTAEGLRVVSWQRMPVPAQRLFKDKVGYGKGSPWSDGHYLGHVEYDGADYPVATRVARQTMWLFNLFTWPNTREDMAFVAKAFDKVFGQLDQIDFKK